MSHKSSLDRAEAVTCWQLNALGYHQHEIAAVFKVNQRCVQRSCVRRSTSELKKPHKWLRRPDHRAVLRGRPFSTGANMSGELEVACLEMARTTKWAQKPIDVSELTKFADKLVVLSKDFVCEALDIDEALIARAVRYLTQVHAIPPMQEDTRWFTEMLRAVLEIARPNTGVDADNKEFLRDLLHGIEQSLSH